MIDLHIHSTASDGSFSVLELMTLAKKAGVKAISITDHDTINGVKEIIPRHNPLKDPEFITGVEVSCQAPEGFDVPGSLHVLGYGFSVYDKTLNATLAKLQQARFDRNPLIVKKLNSLGFEFTIEDVEQYFKEGQTGRPHIAQFLKEKGWVDSFDQAFDKYLGKGKPAYVDKFKVSCKQAIRIILEAGGLPVLAHPGLIEFSDESRLVKLVDCLCEYGLQGIEVYYTDHSSSQMEKFQKLADSRNLIVTGGSDFHGSFNEGVALGTGQDNLCIDYQLFKKLNLRLESIRSEYTVMQNLERNLGYQFKDRFFLENALCHRSYLNENPDSQYPDNERLEFLGDAVLGLCIGHILMQESPTKKEGELSKLRSILVSESTLAQMARDIDLGRFIKLGKGETLSRGYNKDSILSDAFEAVIAAVYLDSGFDNICELIKQLFETMISNVLSSIDTFDYKSALQEYAQEKGAVTPKYKVLKEIGPDHDKTFEISLNLFGVESIGLGKTKKAAEQDSAKKALTIFQKTDL
ncbi:MAG: ribonuclease III [Desulfobacteraceae bacterium]|nr:ribonuclease III [Desulfobacteraceae bacterium]